MRYVVGGVLHPDTFKELQLPLKIANDSFPHRGTGRTSAVFIASAACLASFAAAFTKVDTRIDHEGSVAHTRLLAHTSTHSRSAYDKLRFRTTATPDTPPLQQILSCGGAGATQRALSSLIHDHIARTQSTPDRRTRIMRESVNLPGAKDWLRSLPSPGLQTYIANSSFRTWFGYYSQSPRPTSTICHRCGCTQTLDTYGDHLLVCHLRQNNTSRHQLVVMTS